MLKYKTSIKVFEMIWVFICFVYGDNVQGQLVALLSAGFDVKATEENFHIIFAQLSSTKARNSVASYPSVRVRACLCPRYDAW